MLSRLIRHGVALLVATALVGGAREASAIERQHHLGGGASLSLLSVSDKSTMSIGGGLALHYAYGLSDTWNLMAEVNGSIVARNQQQDTEETPRTRPAGFHHASAGVAYVIDILRWVPYLCVLGGGYWVQGGTLTNDLILPGLAAGAGLDYQLSRDLALGIAARQHFLVTKLDTYPSYTTLLLRAEYMWGW